MKWSQVIEANENLSYGANTIRDGVSLSSVKRVESLLLPSEISQLQDLECLVKFPGDLPVTRMVMTYKENNENRRINLMID